jgi:hypothetical protein
MQQKPNLQRKLFRRQSNQFKVIQLELLGILDETKKIYEKVKSDPPPPLPSAYTDELYSMVVKKDVNTN